MSEGARGVVEKYVRWDGVRSVTNPRQPAVAELSVVLNALEALERAVSMFVLEDEERKIINERKPRGDALRDYRERLKGYGIGLDE